MRDIIGESNMYDCKLIKFIRLNWSWKLHQVFQFIKKHIKIEVMCKIVLNI